ncbi:MAG: PEP-CTERM sorting domain-containing protein [Microcoleaceae cyanobacterium]
MFILNALKVSALTASFATLLFAGSAKAVTFSTGTPNDLVTDIEAEFGGDLDLLADFTETTGNFETFRTFNAEVGDILSFNFDFLSGEAVSPGSLFQDGGFYTLNDEAFLIADSSEMGSVSFDITAAGEYTLGFGAFNATSQTIPPIPGFPLNQFDNEASTLSITNVRQEFAPQAVPEPASMLGLMAVAALGGRSVFKRKHS